MVATRLHLLSAFAGGCLCTAVLVVVWRGSADAPTAPKDRTESTPSLDSPPSPVVEPSSPAADAVALAAPKAEPTEVARLPAPPPEPGRSVAEVLARLEEAYREGMTAAAPREAPTEERETEPRPAEAPPGSSRPATAVARTVPSAATASTAPAAAPLPTTLESTAAPSAPTGVLSVNDARPRRDPADDVKRDVAIAVYQAEEYQRRQLLILQYLELLSQQSRDGDVAPPPRASRPGTTRRSPAFSFPLTNPDNPWGFDLPPTVLVK
jgi:hypothetical protein